MTDLKDRPKATHYTLYEGGEWHPWFLRSSDAGDMFAIKFDDGWIFDTSMGWRKDHAA